MPFGAKIAMKNSSIAGKTVRPGSLNTYSYYYSGNKKSAKAKKNSPKQVAQSRIIRRRVIGMAIVILLIAAVAGYGFMTRNTSTDQKVQKSVTTKSTPTTGTPTSNKPAISAPAAVAQPVPASACSGHTLNKLLLVSLSQRHIWACEGSKSVYDSPVITGMSAYASTVTPTGTYHIYSMQTNTVLRGSDITGSWVDPVNYWMPFLSNKYGIYGLHDAPWRNSSVFGNIDPSSSDASHGCVELPTPTAAWIYNWANVGTTLEIES